MFTINDDLSIYVTRGDVAFFSVTAQSNGTPYKFQPNDVVRIKVFGKKDAENVLMQKDFLVEVETEKVDIILSEKDTKFGDVISKATDYWYEIELNPFTNPQTIIGFDEDGAKIFKLFPEGKDLVITQEEDIPAVDSELSLTSERPVQNQAIARVLIGYEERASLSLQKITETADEAEQRVTETAEETKSEMDSYATNTIEKVASEETKVLGNIETAKDDALHSVSNAESNALVDIASTKDTAIKAIKAEADLAEDRAKSASASAEASADRAEEAMERAETIAGGDFASNSKVDEIATFGIAWLEAPGWYRVAEYPLASENEGKGLSSNSCTLTVKQRYSSKAGDFCELMLLSSYNKQEFKCVASTSSTTVMGVTQARYAYDAEKAYLEVYYSLSVANQLLFEVTHPKDKATSWKIVDATLTSETVDGVTVTATYTIPMNVKPVNSEDLDSVEEAILTRLDSTQTAILATLTEAGWYRVAKGAKRHPNTVLLGISNYYSTGGSASMALVFDNSFENERILPFAISSARAQSFTKARMTIEGDDNYLEVYYAIAGTNACAFTVTELAHNNINKAHNVSSLWEAITPTLTSETVDGVTVTTTYDIPANASPVTSLDVLFQKVATGTDLNDCTKHGVYYFSGVATNYVNTPDSTAHNGVMSVSYAEDSSGASQRVVQKYTSCNTGNSYERTSTAVGTWTEWEQTATTADLANYFKNTGGAVSGNIYAEISSGDAIRVKAQNANRAVEILAGSSEAGVYFPKLSKWGLTCDDSGNITVNGTASGITNGKLSKALTVEDTRGTLLELSGTEGDNIYSRYRGTSGILGLLGFVSKDRPVFVTSENVTQDIHHDGNSKQIVVSDTPLTSSDTNKIRIY